MIADLVDTPEFHLALAWKVVEWQAKEARCRHERGLPENHREEEMRNVIRRLMVGSYS